MSPRIGGAEDTTGKRRFMLFEAACYGHHAYYLRLLLEEWIRSGRSDELLVVVSPEFAVVHRDVAELPGRAGATNVQVIAFTDAEHRDLSDASASRAVPLDDFVHGIPDPRERAHRQWMLMCRYAAHLEVEHVLLTYFDACLLAAAYGADAPCPVSGFYFRPTSHWEPYPPRALSPGEHVQRLQQRFTLARTLRHPKLATLFCLDPHFSVETDGGPPSRIVYLADPVESIASPAPDADALKRELEVEAGRQLLLLFGAFSSRKGTAQVLQALAGLPVAVCERICLALIGPLKSVDEQRLDHQVSEATRNRPLQVLRRHEHVSDAEVASYFHAADLVMAPYQRHVGSSGIVLLAAVHARPVLAQDYGLIGRMVRDHGLGETVDTTDPARIAQVIERFVATGQVSGVDPGRRSAFVAQHDARKFAPTVFRYWP